MQRSAFHSSLGSSDMEVEPVFNVVIAYEDFDSGKQAKETYDFLVHNLGRECRFANQMWKFDVLGIPKLREMAVKDALIADIIIISCQGAHDLSADVKAWINSWVRGQGNAIALVALFTNASHYRENQSMRAYLADVAKNAHMEFFAQPTEFSVKRLDGKTTSDRGPERDDKALSALAGIIQRDQTFPRWGINE